MTAVRKCWLAVLTRRCIAKSLTDVRGGTGALRQRRWSAHCTQLLSNGGGRGRTSGSPRRGRSADCTPAARRTHRRATRKEGSGSAGGFGGEKATRGREGSERERRRDPAENDEDVIGLARRWPQQTVGLGRAVRPLCAATARGRQTRREFRLHALVGPRLYTLRVGGLGAHAPGIKRHSGHLSRPRRRLRCTSTEAE